MNRELQSQLQKLVRAANLLDKKGHYELANGLDKLAARLSREATQEIFGKRWAEMYSKLKDAAIELLNCKDLLALPKLKRYAAFIQSANNLKRFLLSASEASGFSVLEQEEGLFQRVEQEFSKKLNSLMQLSDNEPLKQRAQGQIEALDHLAGMVSKVKKDWKRGQAKPQDLPAVQGRPA